MVPSGRVRILLDYRPALRNRTGVGEYAHQMAAALARQSSPGDRLTIFSSSWKDRLGTDAVPGAATLDAHVPVAVLNYLWHRAEWPPVEWLGAEADVVWSMHPLLMPARHAATVVTIHDLFFLDHPEAVGGEIRRDYPSLAGDHARRADGVIVVSHYTRDLVVARLGVPPERIAVCSPGAAGWTPRIEPPPGGPILHVGTVEPRKNVGALISAYEQLVRTRRDAPPLVFAGRVSSGSVPLTGSSAGLILPDRIRYLGYVADEERLRLYREASMLVVASSDEGFGLPALEAMTMGVPVVAVARGALPEVVAEAGLLVDSDGPVGLAEAMGRVLGDAELRAELARKGVERARLFNWDSSAVTAREALASAIERRGRRS